MYAVLANTGHRPEAAPPPPVLLPAALSPGQPLAGRTVGVCWQVGEAGEAGHQVAGLSWA
jgi:hypothetical protein